MLTILTSRGRLRMQAACVGAALFFGSHAANAINLQQAYALALQNDPVYRAAYFDNESGKEAAVIGRSALLPSVQASYSANKNRADLTSLNFLGKESLTHPEYISRVSTVQLRQPLVNFEALARYKQGKAQTLLSEQTFTLRGQELLLRLVGSYFDALFADEQTALAEAQRNAYAEQKMVNERLLKHGEGTRTDVLEVQARLELSEAQLIEARDNQATARNTLAGIIGSEVGVLSSLNDTFRMSPLEPSGLEQWKALAMQDNVEMQAQLSAIEIAKQDINRARAGHAPRLDFVASYSQNSAETLNTYTQDSTARAIGIQLTIPLYSGGYVNATTRQSVAGLERAKADLQSKIDKTLIEVSRQYSAVQSGMARVNALNRAIESGNLLILATQQSIKGGVRINLDLLNAQQQLFTSKRDLAQARYGYLLAWLKLRASAGVLGVDDVRQMAAYFH